MLNAAVGLFVSIKVMKKRVSGPGHRTSKMITQCGATKDEPENGGALTQKAHPLFVT